LDVEDAGLGKRSATLGDLSPWRLDRHADGNVASTDLPLCGWQLTQLSTLYQHALALSFALVVRLLDGSTFARPPAQVAPKAGERIEFVTTAQLRSGSHHGVIQANLSPSSSQFKLVQAVGIV
jgi:hypothetical protein